MVLPSHIARICGIGPVANLRPSWHTPAEPGRGSDAGEVCPDALQSVDLAFAVKPPLPRGHNVGADLPWPSGRLSSQCLAANRLPSTRRVNPGAMPLWPEPFRAAR